MTAKKRVERSSLSLRFTILPRQRGNLVGELEAILDLGAKEAEFVAA